VPDSFDDSLDYMGYKEHSSEPCVEKHRLIKAVFKFIDSLSFAILINSITSKSLLGTHSIFEDIGAARRLVINLS
jgi:hypothetical protein